MPEWKHLDTYDGTELKVLCNGILVASLNSLDWKASQNKSVKHAVGHVNRNSTQNKGNSATGIQRGVKDYTLNLEVHEMNKALLTEAVDEEKSQKETLSSFTIDGQTYEDLLDLRGLEILILYPEVNNTRRRAKFFGVEFTDNEGGLNTEEVKARKLSAIATGATGLI